MISRIGARLVVTLTTITIWLALCIACGTRHVPAPFRWYFEAQYKIDQPPQLLPGRAVVGSWDGSLYCLREESGHVVWRYEADDAICTPSIAYGSTIWVASCDGYLHSIDATDGKEKYSFPVMQHPSFLLKVDSGLAVANENELWIIETNGSTRQKYELGSDVSAIVSNATQLFVGTYQGSIFLLAPPNPLPKLLFSSLGAKTNLQAVGDLLYFTSLGEGVIALDSHGKEAWRRSAPEAALSDMRATSELLLYGEGSDCYCLDIKTGGQEWVGRVGGRVTSVGLDAAHAFCGTSDGKLHAFDLLGGNPQGTLQVDGALSYISPMQRELYVVTGNGRLYSVSKETLTLQVKASTIE